MQLCWMMSVFNALLPGQPNFTGIHRWFLDLTFTCRDVWYYGLLMKIPKLFASLHWKTLFLYYWMFTNTVVYNLFLTDLNNFTPRRRDRLTLPALLLLSVFPSGAARSGIIPIKPVRYLQFKISDSIWSSQSIALTPHTCELVWQIISHNKPWIRQVPKLFVIWSDQ